MTTGKDSFSLCIGHREPGNMVVLDCLRERQPRFVPKDVVKEYSDLLKLYRVSRIKSDRFANAWAADEWTRHGITCEPSALSKSEIYLAALPVLMSGQARLLDSEKRKALMNIAPRQKQCAPRQSCRPMTRPILSPR